MSPRGKTRSVCGAVVAHASVAARAVCSLPPQQIKKNRFPWTYTPHLAPCCNTIAPHRPCCDATSPRKQRCGAIAPRRPRARSAGYVLSYGCESTTAIQLRITVRECLGVVSKPPASFGVSRAWVSAPTTDETNRCDLAHTRLCDSVNEEMRGRRYAA